MKHNPHIQAVDIAEAAGLSPCRVRQILRFARLHPEIQKTILQLSPKKTLPRTLPAATNNSTEIGAIDPL
jgi:hypothetical protein